MNSNSEQNELTSNPKISYTLVVAYSLLGFVTVIMTGLLCYYLYRIFE